MIRIIDLSAEIQGMSARAASKHLMALWNAAQLLPTPGERRAKQAPIERLMIQSCALSHWTAPESELRVSEATETATAPAAPDPAAVQRAADHISATEISDGNWAHYARETHRWYVVTVAELAELCDYLDHADDAIRQDAYSHWCAGTSAREMPLGWSPDGA